MCVFIISFAAIRFALTSIDRPKKKVGWSYYLCVYYKCYFRGNSLSCLKHVKKHAVITEALTRYCFLKGLVQLVMLYLLLSSLKHIASILLLKKTITSAVENVCDNEFA